MLNESLHKTIIIKKGEFFIKRGETCKRIGQLHKGVLRGFVFDNEGNDITTHFYQEGDMIVGSYIPNVNVAFSIEALEDCEISVANYSEIMSHVNKDREITGIITKEFQRSNAQLQARLVSLLNLNSVEKYELFLNEYPSLLNRIPHYYIANYLGITPTQLSRARKQFISKNK